VWIFVDEKPVELSEYLKEFYSKKFNVEIIDVFIGAETTRLKCLKNNKCEYKLVFNTNYLKGKVTQWKQIISIT